MSVRRLEGAKQMIAIIESARASNHVGPNADARLARALSFYEFFMEEMTRALEEWRRAID
jgi:hypothetical protein